MFTKVIYLTLVIASIDEFAGVTGHPQLPNGFNSLLPGSSQPNLFPNMNFDVPTLPPLDKPAPANATTCTCAVFMSGQFKRNSAEQPTGFPALISELELAYPCNPMGMKSCVNRCLESVSWKRRDCSFYLLIRLIQFYCRLSSTCPTQKRSSAEQ